MTGKAPTNLLGDVGGAATVEYVVVLVLVAMVGAVAIWAAGVPLVRTFDIARLLIASPMP